MQHIFIYIFSFPEGNKTIFPKKLPPSFPFSVFSSAFLRICLGFLFSFQIFAFQLVETNQSPFKNRPRRSFILFIFVTYLHYSISRLIFQQKVRNFGITPQKKRSASFSEVICTPKVRHLWRCISFSAGVFIFYLTIFWQKRESARAEGGREGGKRFPQHNFANKKALKTYVFKAFCGFRVHYG